VVLRGGGVLYLHLNFWKGKWGGRRAGEVFFFTVMAS